jgi:branched-chain amino acid transport system substrate-binding protein
VLLQDPSITRNAAPVLHPASRAEADIIRVKTGGSHPHRIIVGHGLRPDAPEFEEIHRECVTGWQNPFLCI